MYKLIEFIRRSYVTILFVILEIAAINYYAHSTPYTRARLLASANSVFGGVHGVISGFGEYFSLARENRILTARVAELEQQLTVCREAAGDVGFEPAELQYEFMPARVVSNSINRSHNFITLNRGLRDGVVNDMAVLSPSGAIVGYILDCSERYSVAISVLNTSFRTSGKIAGDGYSGSIEWRSDNPHKVTMYELSKYANIEVGAQVVTTGFSHYFPADLPIGTIEDFRMKEDNTAYTATVRLATDFTKLHNVLLVKNIGQGEVMQLEEDVKLTTH
ncbi:MAG: rod shape-determining protein MreC [Alistipes sp.]|nr:rod shape-determining protein MreC [Alistipes sp.]